jgi:hypothetical protein
MRRAQTVVLYGGGVRRGGGRDGLHTWADHDANVVNADGFKCAKDVTQHRLARKRVQHLRVRRIHPRAVARSENDCSDTSCVH